MAVSATSPLTELDLSPSPSFVTANTSASNVEESTTASSPVAEPSPSRFPLARQLPRELKEHCRIYLEEQLYHCAIGLLNSTLCAGNSRPRPQDRPKAVYVPPTSQLALLASLAVHPTHTTRAATNDRLEVSSQALSYLSNLLFYVGPVNPNLKDAFQFVGASSVRGRSAAPHKATARGFVSADEDTSSGGEEHLEDHVHGKMANQNSVWHRASSFWAVVGWAFNCSVAHPHRWRYWKPWLEFMLDVMDGDWEERRAMDCAEDAMDQCPRLHSSMLMSYLKRGGSGRAAASGLRDVMKALFADGTRSFMLTFQEVFEKEAKAAVDPSKKRKREKELDLDNGKFGDYYDDESFSSGDSQPPTPEKRRGSRPAQQQSELVSPGMAESIGLRIRCFRLLYAAAWFCGDEFVDHETLCQSYYETLVELPVDLFALYLIDHPKPLATEVHTYLVQEMLHCLLPASHRGPAEVDPDVHERGGVSQAILEECYLPCAAACAVAVDNARVSLLLENLMYGLWRSDGLQYSPNLREALEKGIRAREAKAGRRKAARGKGGEEEARAREVLSMSTQRLQSLVDMMEHLDTEAARAAPDQMDCEMSE